MTKYEQETLLEDGLSLLASAIPHLSSYIASLISLLKQGYQRCDTIKVL